MKTLAAAALGLVLFGWTVVLNTSGKGTKQTETFKITTKEWRVSWTAKESDLCPKCGVFQIYLYRADGTIVNVVANVQGADTDSSIMRGAGSYYLMINSNVPWTVKVEQPTPD